MAGPELRGQARLVAWEGQGLTLQLLFPVLLSPSIHISANNRSSQRPRGRMLTALTRCQAPETHPPLHPITNRKHHLSPSLQITGRGRHLLEDTQLVGWNGGRDSAPSQTQG